MPSEVACVIKFTTDGHRRIADLQEKLKAADVALVLIDLRGLRIVADEGGRGGRGTLAERIDGLAGRKLLEVDVDSLPGCR